MKKLKQRLLCLLLTLCTLLSLIPLAALPVLANETDTGSAQSAQPQSNEQTNEIILFEEDFNDVTEKVSFAQGENTEGVTAGWYYDRHANSTREAYVENGKLYVSGSGVDKYYDVLYRVGGEKWQNYTLEADFCYTDGNVGWGGIVYNRWGFKKLQKASFSGTTAEVTVALNGMNSSWTNNTSGVNSKKLTNENTAAIMGGAPVRMKIVSHFESASLYYAMLNDDGTMKTDWIFVMSIDNIAENAQQGSIGLMTSAGANVTNFWIDNIKCYQSVPSDVLYSEDFSYADTTLSTGINTSLGLNYIKNSANGVAQIKDGALQISGSGTGINAFDAVLLSEGSNWTDYTVEADYTYLMKETGWSGLMFRSTDVKNFQKAVISPYYNASTYPNGSATINGKSGGSWYQNGTAIEALNGNSVELNKPFRMRITVVGTVAQLFVAYYDESGKLGDWSYVRESRDRFADVHMQGTVGVIIGGGKNTLAASVAIDNLIVRKATAEDLYVEPDYVTEVYLPESGIVNPPVVVQSLTDTLPAKTGERPAVLLMNVDANMNVLSSDGEVLTTVEKLVDDYRTALLPAFIVDSTAEADALATLITDKKLTECYVVADANAANLVYRVRTKNTTTQKITGALIFDDLNTPEACENARYLVTENMSIVAISRTPLSKEAAYYFNLRQIAAWGTVTDDAGIYAGIANGYHGVVTENASAVYDIYESIKTPTVSGKPIIISHRGENKLDSATRHPENTLSAIKAAKDVYNADGVEIDLKITKDGYLVLMHDADVDRTTDGTGNVADLTLAEIKAMNVDYLAGKTEKIPTFEEVLETIKDMDIVVYCHVATISDAILASASYLIDKYDCTDKVVFFVNHKNRATYNASNTSTYTSTAYGFTDYPVALDGMMFVLGGDGYIFSHLTGVNDGLKAIRDAALPNNFQPFFYPYSKNADNAALWNSESFYYQMSARGFVNSHSVTNGQENLDFYLLTGVGAVGLLTDNTTLTNDYHYAIETGKTYFALGEALELTKTLKLNLGTADATCGFIQLAGPTLESVAGGYTLNTAGSVTLVYYADRTTSGGSTYRIYSEPVTVTFDTDARFTGASLNLGADLSMLYYARINNPELLDGALAVRFSVNGVAHTVTEYQIIDGEYVFTLLGIAPQQIGDEISATLLCDGEEIASHSGYSAKKNLTNLLAKNAEALDISEEKYAAMKTLISDLLVYGEAAQNYINYAPDALITDGVTGLVPSTATPTEKDDMILQNHVDASLCFKYATVNFNTVNEIRIRIFVGDIDKSLVRVTVNGTEYQLSELTALGNGIYQIAIPELLATELDNMYTIELSYNGVTGASLSYSANAYAYAMCNGAASNAKMQSLALALYRYGVSADAYMTIS